MKKYFKPVIKPHKLKGMTILAGSGSTEGYVDGQSYDLDNENE